MTWSAFCDSLLEHRIVAERSWLERDTGFDVLGIDSVSLFEILDLLEVDYNLILPDDVVAALTSFQDLKAAIDAYPSASSDTIPG